MKNYEDLLLERVQILTGKLAQKQREGCLTEELSLCIRLAQLHSQLDSPKISVQFWQSCMQIATDLEEKDEIWRAAAEIAKIYCKEGQIEAAEEFMKEHLTSSTQPEPLRLTLLKSEVITAMAPSSSQGIKEFLALERALKVLDEAFESTTSSEDIWWWDAVAFRSELLLKLGKFDESRFKEAIDVVNAIQSGVNEEILMSLRCKAILAKIYFEMREYAAALDTAILVIDQYKSDAGNANYRPRRRIYCEMLLLAGRALRFQKDFNFSLQNLLLAKDEAEALGVERDFMTEISSATQETIEAKSAADEATILQRRKHPTPKDIEELADKLGLIGDFEGQLELLEKCRTVATSETTRRRLDKKLINLYFNELRNWQAVLRIESSSDDWRVLLLKGRALMNLGKSEEAEEFLLDALRESDGNLATQSALYFYYRQRGKLTIAQKYETEALSLETISNLKTATAINRNVLIDPNFSYFATRKPSNSLMKMVGSGMVMRTKTKKTKGLQLKRRRGPSKLRHNTSRVKRSNSEEESEDEDSGLSDFIVSDEESETTRSDTINRHERGVNLTCDNISISISRSDTKKLEKSRSLIIVSSSDSEPETVTKPTVSNHYGIDSPLMIRTETLDEPVMKIKIDFDDENSNLENDGNYCKESYNNNVNRSNKSSSNRSNVIVKFKKGIQVLIPTTLDVTVKELMKTAQMRFNHLFPEESKRFGQICGLSLDNSAMLFPDDRLELILPAGGTETTTLLQAHFKEQHSNSGITFDSSPSKLNTIEEDFKRKIQILNLKSDNSEINFLKTFQNRFKMTRNELNLSALSMDSMKFSEYSSYINKYIKLTSLKRLNLSENLLCDEDLRHISTTFFLEEINLSANFLQKPNSKMFLNCDFVDFSYNPIDLGWLINNVNNFKGMNLIGCFELLGIANDNWDELGVALSSLKRLGISNFQEFPSRFFSNLCNGTLEEVEFFAVDWKSEILVELSYLDRLKSLKFTGCSFTRNALESLGKVLKRTCSLEVLQFTETEFDEKDWLLIKEGIEGNFSLKKVIKD